MSKNAKKQRLRAWVFTTFFILILSFLWLSVSNDTIEMGHYLGAIPTCIIGILCFPYFFKFIQKKQLLKHTNEVYKNNYGKEINLLFGTNTIEIQNALGISKINYSALEKIIETSSHFFMVLKAGSYIIIPKSSIKNMDDFRVKIKNIASKSKILYSTELDWKW
ncbi:hypothetical protein BWZ22_02420 [Seonamhaeicola sp. S2-3]|nr:hypothetical protein BWZ22_02420 [Seonamhaeicola sp. S2-3]